MLRMIPWPCLPNRSGRRACGVSVWCISALTLVACGPAAHRSEQRPNLLLVVIDTLRADHLGCYGHGNDPTPNLDALASKGARFESFRSVVPTTLASFTSILTSEYPVDHGVYRNGIPRPEGSPSLPELLSESGYTSAAFVSSFCLSSRFGLHLGFDHYDEELPLAIGLPQNRVIRRGSETTDAALAWLRERDGEQPWFAMVHYFDPHWPYAPPPHFVSEGGVDVTGAGSFGAIVAARRRFRATGEADAAMHRLHELYKGEIRYVDQQIGRLIDRLEDLPAMRNTYVVVTADHGESILEHADPFNHGLTVYETNIRIPLIVTGPTVPTAVVSTPGATIDLAPTLLELAEVEAPDTFRGRSLLSELSGGPAGSPRPLFAEATQPFDAEAGQIWPNRRKARSVLLDDLKLIHTPWRGDRFELYDLGDDPLEEHDLIGAGRVGEYSDFTELENALSSWSAQPPHRIGVGRSEFDVEVRKKLRSLGYVE